MIDAVLLDVGGVFVMPGHELILAVARAHGGGTADGSLDHAHYRGIAAGETAPGPFDWDAYRRAVLSAAGVPADRLADASADLATAMSEVATKTWNHPLTGSAHGLQQLCATGVPMAIVSNADGTIEELLLQLGLCQLGTGPLAVMAAIVDSGVVGIEKPDPAIFTHALEATGSDPARTVHVGDTLHADVVGATAAGVRPLHLDPVGWCEDDGHEHVPDLAAVAELVLAERG